MTLWQFEWEQIRVVAKLQLHATEKDLVILFLL